jgi:predicted DNA-binding transcriptional regulator YafY
MDDPLRVHVRALARLQHIHQELSTGRCPSVRDLAARVYRNPRTIKRDVKALRDDFQAPLVYDRQRKGLAFPILGFSEHSWTFLANAS